MCQLNKKPTEYILLGWKNRVSRFYFGVRSIFFISSCRLPLVHAAAAAASRMLYNGYNMYVSDMKMP